MPQLAVSLVSLHDYNFEKAAQFVEIFCAAILKKTWPKGTLFNINIPKRVKELDYAVTRLGHHDMAAMIASVMPVVVAALLGSRSGRKS